MVMSAVLHDFEHPGYNNQFAINCGLKPAQMFNDQAVSPLSVSRSEQILHSDVSSPVLLSLGNYITKVLLTVTS